MTDWGEAGKIAAFGVTAVFVALGALQAAITLVGSIIRRYDKA